METATRPKAVGYIRVSTNRQAENGYGLDAQRDQITRYCESNGLDLVALIPDVMSGKRTDKLYGRIAAIPRFRTGMANVLVVNTLDRSSRSMADGAKLVADAKARRLAHRRPGRHRQQHSVATHRTRETVSRRGRAGADQQAHQSRG